MFNPWYGALPHGLEKHVSLLTSTELMLTVYSDETTDDVVRLLLYSKSVLCALIVNSKEATGWDMKSACLTINIDSASILIIDRTTVQYGVVRLNTVEAPKSCSQWYLNHS